MEQIELRFATKKDNVMCYSVRVNFEDICK